ncbi:unnamed protein product [Sphagnum tenellum]
MYFPFHPRTGRRNCSRSASKHILSITSKFHSVSIQCQQINHLSSVHFRRCQPRMGFGLLNARLLSCEAFSYPVSLLIRGATTEDVEAEKELIELDAMERMEKTLEATRSNFNTVRTGRASPSLLDRVEVEYYGTPVILKSIAQVSTPDGSTLLIQPFDKSSLAAIEKALIKSDLGLTPSNDGNVIRLTVPQLTADRRKELLKLVSRLTEDGKVALRNVRRDAMKAYDKLEKEKKLSADNVKDLSEDIQKLTDEYVKKVETLFKQKEKELTTV